MYFHGIIVILDNFGTLVLYFMIFLVAFGDQGMFVWLWVRVSFLLTVLKDGFNACLYLLLSELMSIVYCPLIARLLMQDSLLVFDVGALFR